MVHVSLKSILPLSLTTMIWKRQYDGSVPRAIFANKGKRWSALTLLILALWKVAISALVCKIVPDDILGHGLLFLHTCHQDLLHNQDAGNWWNSSKVHNLRSGWSKIQGYSDYSNNVRKSESVTVAAMNSSPTLPVKTWVDCFSKEQGGQSRTLIEEMNTIARLIWKPVCRSKEDHLNVISEAWIVKHWHTLPGIARKTTQ